jgi:hypothetical protein
MDTNRDDLYQSTAIVSDQLVGQGVMGNQTCANMATSYVAYLSIPDTCDTSKWRDDVLVRKQLTLIMATSEARIIRVTPKTNSGFSVVISDNNLNSLKTLNGFTVGANSMPTGSKISVGLIATQGLQCKLIGATYDVVPLTTESLSMDIFLDGASDCGTARVIVTVEATRSKTKSLAYF